MTVGTETSKAGPYSTNGATTVFSFDFPVYEEDHVLAYLYDETTKQDTLLVNGVDYEITLLNGGEDGGSVTISPAKPAGYKVTLLRDVGYLQDDYDPSSGSTYFADQLERAMDMRVMQIQALREVISRVLKISSGSTGIDLTLPPPEPGQIIAWNAEGTGLTNMSADELAATQIAVTWVADTFDGDGTEDTFALTRSPGASANMDVSIDGVTQVPGVDFNLVGQAIVFTTAPEAGTKVLVRYGSAVSQTQTLAYQRFVATTAQTVFTLPTAYAPGTNSVQVFMNGLKLQPAYDFQETNNVSITLALGAVEGDEIEIYWGRFVQEGVIGTQNLEDDAVTAAKLAPGIYTDQVADFRLGNHPATREGTWLLCDGTAVSRTTYAALYARLGTTYGPGDGSTSFNLPTIAALSGGAANLSWYVKAI